MFGRASDSIPDPHMVNTASFLPNILSNFKQKSNFGHHIYPGNTTLWCKDRKPLLIGRFISSIGYIRKQSYEVFIAYLIPLWSTQHLFYQTYSQIPSRITIFGHHIYPDNVTVCCKNRHPLLIECFISFLRCIRRIERAFGSISDPMMVNTLPFLPNKLSIFKQNNQFGAPHLPWKRDTMNKIQTTIAA